MKSHQPRSTQAFLRPILFRLRRDRQLKLPVNDAVDVLYCVVPAAYCDFVPLEHNGQVRLTNASARREALLAPRRRGGSLSLKPSIYPAERLTEGPVTDEAI